ncbi:sulfotransferase domain-containing protein [Synechococcus sp. CS-1330]|nr:sulfotransferase domain-containing protein [Synechococcus sp. CS-1330]
MNLFLAAKRTAWRFLDVPVDLLVASRKIRRRKQILLACFPKSGSTFLSSKLCRLPGCSRADFLPAYGRRDQELERAAIVRSMISLSTFNKSLVAQHYCRASEHSLRLVNKFDMKVVVLVRSLMDVALSLSDHWDRESVVGPIVYLSESLLAELDASPVTRLQFIVQHVLPWYVSFYLSWLRHGAEVRGGVLFIRYEQFFCDPVRSFLEVAQFVGENMTQEQLELNLKASDQTRLNKGLPGRGMQAFEADPIAYQKLLDLLVGYPGVDFSPIFQPLACFS